MPSARLGEFFDDDYIFGRWNELITSFEKWRTIYYAQPGVVHKIDIDPYALFIAVRSYFHDVVRYKWWHFSDPKNKLIDDNKIASFTLYWLMKHRPVYVSTPHQTTLSNPIGSEDDDPSIAVNAAFATAVAFNFLGFRLKGSIHTELVYNLMYRNPSPYDLMMYFGAIETLMRASDASTVATFFAKSS